ncbi:hypothetical protein [Streptomyces sp. NPDC058548]|uniref:hypothetical protein n=1 Tax=Streptomyces sp. NPDC058548 TaxID=3346545 RepID=UPI003658BD86
MSLTSCLKDPHSPISQFLSTELPAMPALIGHYRAQLPMRPDTARPQDPGPFSYRSLGQAIDLRLRIAFGTPIGSPLTAGILLTARSMGDSVSLEAALAVADTGQALLGQLKAQPAATPGAMLREPSTEEQVARLCFVAAWFEEVYRQGLNPGNPLLHGDLARRLEGMLEQVPHYVPGDIAQMAALADRPGALQCILELGEADRVCGPTFAGSHHVGGADADYIAGGHLIDCKATIHPQRLGRAELYQLAGYLLLDYDDVYGIDRVGLYLARQGRLVDWEVAEFLALLGARRSLPELRAACRDALTSDRPAWRLPEPRRSTFEQDSLFG